MPKFPKTKTALNSLHLLNWLYWFNKKKQEQKEMGYAICDVGLKTVILLVLSASAVFITIRIPKSKIENYNTPVLHKSMSFAHHS